MSPTVFPAYLANGKCAGGLVFCFILFLLDVVALKSFGHMAGVEPFCSPHYFLKHNLKP